MSLTRRRAMQVAGGAVLASGLGLPAVAGTEQFVSALARLTAGRVPGSGRVRLTLPELAEDGSSVPLTVVVESPMTVADHVTSVTLLSEENPFAEIATFRFSPLSGRAGVTTRIRLARSQTVHALAGFSDGGIEIASAAVIVAVGGCDG